MENPSSTWSSIAGTGTRYRIDLVADRDDGVEVVELDQVALAVRGSIPRNFRITVASVTLPVAKMFFSARWWCARPREELAHQLLG
jgi:hypothetical protein